MNTSAPAAQPHHHAPRARWAQVLRWLAVCSAGAVCAVMVGCAVPGKEALGSARADVAVRLGPPTAVYPRPEGGERWQYSELPAGVQVYNLDFDATGRLVRNAPALTQAWLEQIPVGQWTVSDVRYWLGAPQRVDRVARFEGEVWTYRFLQLSDPRSTSIHRARCSVCCLWTMYPTPPTTAHDGGAAPHF